MVDQSRRSIIGRLAAALTAAPIAAALPAIRPSPAHPAPALVGPITPDQYIAEMHAMGWECHTVIYENGAGEEFHAGTVENVADWYVWNSSDDNAARRRRLLRAVDASGPDFYRRTGHRLFELGFTKPV